MMARNRLPITLFLLWGLVLLIGLSSETVTAGDHPSTRSPVLFDSEIVRLFVEGDTLEVEGIYLLLCSAQQTNMVTLFYPYPGRNHLGEAHTVLLQARPPGGEWRPLSFEEVDHQRTMPTGEIDGGARWWVPLDMGDSLEVRTVYRQALTADCATYIVTTTSAWGQPLKNVRFEIHLPQGLDPTSFSFPFRLVTPPSGTYYLFETSNFMPEVDIDVCWEDRNSPKVPDTSP